MRRYAFMLGAAAIASIVALPLATTPAKALVGNVSSALRTAQSTALTPVHCRRYWHCHNRGCHRCGVYYHRHHRHWRWWW